jgi:hypothetical protein
MTDVLTNLSDEVFRIEKEHIKPISLDAINDIISFLKQSDKELRPILDVMHRLIENCQDEQLRTMTVLKVLKFYGINNHDILSSRQKIVIENKTLSKKPFLKKSQRDNVEALLEGLDIEVI